jgi:pimeloyl-ACP methyl ester carboxylesterase
VSAPRDGYSHTRDGLRLFYRDYAGSSSRTPVLCLAGLTRNNKDFVSTAERLAPMRRVIAPDQRGRGLSDRDPNWMHYNPAVYVEDMWGLLGSLGLKRVIVIGTSLGGLMAMLMAAWRPQALAGVVLNDVGPELDPRGADRIRNYVGRLPPVRNWDEALAQIKTVHQAALPDLSEEQWLAYARNSYREDKNGVPLFDADPKIGDAVRFMPTNVAFAMWMAYAGLNRIPTLLLRGARSDLLSEQTAARMRREKPDLKYVTIPNRGHAPLLNEPASIAAIDDFLATIP